MSGNSENSENYLGVGGKWWNSRRGYQRNCEDENKKYSIVKYFDHKKEISNKKRIKQKELEKVLKKKYLDLSIIRW